MYEIPNTRIAVSRTLCAGLPRGPRRTSLKVIFQKFLSGEK